MKNLIFLSILTLFVASCVQKSYKRTVVLTLDVSGIKDIQTVELRGEGNPLSWNKDLEMKPIKKDSLYTVSVTAVTGYKFAEIKFVVNGKFELENQENRRIYFDEKSDTTFYNAKFDVLK
jgi:PBP1b-binding outer membrane lipoprotein LpoB